MADFTINTDITENSIADIVVKPVAQRNENSNSKKSATELKTNSNVQKSIYGELPQIPTQDAVEGIKFDFNHGIRILFPDN